MHSLESAALLLAMFVVTAIRTVGVVLTSAMLVTPAVAAGQLTGSRRWLFVLSALIACVSCTTGLCLAGRLQI
ncbi:MAG: metal ABC transporter permease, partial [Planctomycetaceae bacterium]